MLSRVRSCSLVGIDAFAVDVEVDVAGGSLPSYHVVGMPAASVREGAVRIRSAIENVGCEFPRKKITVNLAPADRRKQGTVFDLPIALGILAGAELLSLESLGDLMMMGELALDGSLRPVRGALAAALLARDRGIPGIVVPEESAGEAAAIDSVRVHVAQHLGQIVAAARGECVLPRVVPSHGIPHVLPSQGDMSDVRGQRTARTAIEVAVAGGHNMLMVGPPGIGKTMLARRIPTVLPPLELQESLEVTRIYSSAGMAPRSLIRQRPFRAPHHTISTAALVGGGRPTRAGECSLAHAGVLFLDEMAELSRSSVEALRQPMEDQSITIARIEGVITLPARFLLVGSANPCPCGWFGSRERTCTCSGSAIARYRAKFSGPLIDRIDVQIYVPNVSVAEIRSGEAGESSEAMRNRVVVARERQARRLRDWGTLTNAAMSPRAMRATCRLSEEAEQALARVCRARALSARAIDRVIKVARTIEDLDAGAHTIEVGPILEAASYRSLDSDPTTHDSRLLRSLGALAAGESRTSTRRSTSASASTR